MDLDPVYPITVVFHEDGDQWTLNDADELATSLEYFDSEDPGENATVKDALGRFLRLKVDRLELVVCEVKESS